MRALPTLASAIPPGHSGGTLPRQGYPGPPAAWTRCPAGAGSAIAPGAESCLCDSKPLLRDPGA